MGTVIFDPRIDMVLMEVDRFNATPMTLFRFKRSPQARILKDVRYFCIRTLYQVDEAPRIFDDALGHIIALILPSLETLIYDPGSEPRPGCGSSYGGNNGNCDQDLSSSSRIDIARKQADFQELYLQRICESLEKCKRCGMNPEWNIPRVLSTLDIHGEKVDVQRILGQ